jgi:hypothetical protein
MWISGFLCGPGGVADIPEVDWYGYLLRVALSTGVDEGRGAYQVYPPLGSYR